MRRGNTLWFIIYLVFGVYFINSALNFFPMSESFLIVDKWISLIGGVLILVGAFNLLRLGRRYRY